MATTNEPPRKIILRAVAQGTDSVADLTLNLWQHLASQLISIIGEGGFKMLYERSLHLTSSSFPWLAPGSTSPEHDAASGSHFEDLKMNLEERAPPDARAASSALFVTFTDLLASMIGEPLTIRILDSAWAGVTSDGPAAEQQECAQEDRRGPR